MIAIEGQFDMGIMSLQFLSLVLQMELSLVTVLWISDISLSLVICDASLLEDELFSLLLLPVEAHPVLENTSYSQQLLW